MNKFAPKSLAIGLAALFTLAAAPAYTQAGNVSLSAAKTVHSTQEKTNAGAKEKDAAPLDLPDIFYKAVRGCTTDGYIYRLTYNLSVDLDELAKPPAPNTPPHERSLLYRLVQKNPDSVLGVSGTDRFMEALNTIINDIHNDMQIITGQLIDDSPAEFLSSMAFQEMLDMAAKEIAADFKARYGVTIKIHASVPTEQAGRCEPAPPPELLPQKNKQPAQTPATPAPKAP